MSLLWRFAQPHNPLDAVLEREPEGSLFIGGLQAVDQPDLLEQHGITHILSVLEYDHCDWPEFSGFHRLWICAEDHPGQNILQHLEQSNAFIDQAMAANGRVLVHCAMGVSRSATVVCAFLMYRHGLSFWNALDQLQQVRSVCVPNHGFSDQLTVFEHILRAPCDEARRMIYAD